MAATSDVIDTAELVSRLDLVAVFALFIIAGSLALARDWIYTGRRVRDIHDGHERELRELRARTDELAADRDFWRSAALRTVGLAEKFTGSTGDD